MTAVNDNRLRRSTTGVNLRNRVLRLSTRPQPSNSGLEPLFRAVRANHAQANLALLERAYAEADKWHTGQMRKSGDPYITHPLAVTTNLADIGMTADARRRAAPRHRRGHGLHAGGAARRLR